MNQKIEWYQEVLELEPNSRVFFPLAKLLAADSRNREAIEVLQQGLARHPSYVEARLFLVDLLLSQNAGTKLDSEVEHLASLFSAYPGFWNVWSARLAQAPGMQDAALALRFFCASLRGTPLTWASVIEQGLQTVLGVSAPVPSGSPAVREAVPSQNSVSASSCSPQDKLDPAIIPDAPEQDEEDEEAFSLRTRTMADVLAEQGDIAGALEIYRELKNEASGDSAIALQGRIDELTRQMSAPHSVEPSGENPHPSAGMESGRLVSLLESLAQRLEARAR